MNLIPKNLSQLRRIALAVLLASFAILETTSISAQEPGRTITSPFGVANPYMNASDASESGSDGDTFVDPETGEVGHIIRNPFGVANPEGVDTGIDIPDSEEEEVGGVITNPFGVPASDDIDTGVDVIDEDEEYLISLPDDEESEVEDTEDVEEINDEPSDDEKEKIDKIEFSEDFSRNDESISTKGALPPKDAPRNTGEDLGFDFKLVGTSEGATSVTINSVAGGTLYVLSGNDFVIEAQPIRGQFPGDPTWTITSNNPGGPTPNSGIPYKTGVTQTSTKKTYTANPAYEYGSYNITVRSDSYGHTVIRKIDIVVVTLNLTIHNPIGANSDYASLLATNIADESSTNIANESSAEKPDYANFEARSGETSLKRMDLRINFGNLNRNQCNVKFDYDGVDEIPDPNTTTPTIINDDELKYIYKRNQANGYYDYTTKWKQKELRIWASPNNSIIDKSSRDCRNYNPTGDNGGNYLAPATYTINQLNPNGNSSACTKILYLEGINPSADTVTYTPVTVELYYNSKKIVSKVVRLNIIEGRVILNVNNDPNYILDEIDHKIKDQQGGFKGWFAKELSGANVQEDKTQTSYELENLFPVLLKDLSPLPDGMRYVLKVNHSGALLDPGYDYDPTDAGGSIFNYIRDNTTVETLFHEHFEPQPHVPASGGPPVTMPPNPPSNKMFFATSQPGKKDKLFLFGVYQGAQEMSCTSFLSLCVCGENTEDVLLTLDQALYTITPIDKFFEVWSTREPNPDTYFDKYHRDPPHLANPSEFKTFMDADCLDDMFAQKEERDNTKDVLVFLHGFNVNLAEGFDFHRTIFRRLYWTGYRGNYIGWCWTGNDIGDGTGIVQEENGNVYFEVITRFAKEWFDTNVYRALQSSRALCKFIRTELAGCAHVNLAAHSLGNLVMWDALRLNTYNDYLEFPTTKQIDNVISIEGAVWSEAFREPKRLIYNHPGDDSIYYASLTDNATIEDMKTGKYLERHSWSHWFRNDYHDALSNVSNFVNSRTKRDSVLIGLKAWNALCHGDYDHYNRFASESSPVTFRGPYRNSLPEMAALMKQGRRKPFPTPFRSLLDLIYNATLGAPLFNLAMFIRDYGNYIEQLSDPMGLADLSEYCPDKIQDYYVNENDDDPNTTNSGWDESSHNDMKNALFCTIYEWYRMAFSEKSNIIKP